MNIRESINRGFNLLAVSLAGVAGFSFLPEVFVEKDVPDKMDDLILFIIGIIAVIWYNKSNNKYFRSGLPVLFVVLGLIVKVLGLLVELDDPEAFGDDIGGVIFFLVATIIVVKQGFTTNKLLEMNK